MILQVNLQVRTSATITWNIRSPLSHMGKTLKMVTWLIQGLIEFQLQV